MTQSAKEWLLILIATLSLWFTRAAAVDSHSLYPDPKLTPGKTNPNLNKETLCSKEFRTGMYRKVSEAKRRMVFKEYGIDYRNHVEYEVDHLIPIELGGSNDLSNLWPQAYQPHPGAKEKDIVENYFHKQVCEGKISLEEAQRGIVQAWDKVKIEK